MLHDEEATESQLRSAPASAIAATPALYLAGIVLAEVATRAGQPALAVTLFAVVLIIGLNHAATTIGPERALLLASAVVVLERLMSLTMNLMPIGGMYRYPLTALPTLAGVALVARLARYSRHDLGLVVNARVARYSLLVLLPGMLIGILYYALVRPVPLFRELGSTDAVVPIMVLALTTGFLDELLFRGLLQRAATLRLGRLLGIAYGSMLYAILAAVPLSAIGIATVLATALCLAALTVRTHSILPAVAAHASLTVGVLLVAPFVLS